MGRIRSVHPGLFKDEAVMELSMTARFLAIGIWTLADDHGVFEWKPKVIRAELFPGDNVEIEALLGELVTHGLIKRFENSGRPYAVVRNFCLYQRPKMPSYRHPFPEAIASYAGVERRSAEELVQASAKRPHVRPDDSDSATPALPQASTSATEKPPHRRGEESSRREEESNTDREKPVVVVVPDAKAEETTTTTDSQKASQVKRLGELIGKPLPAEWIPDDALCEKVLTDFGMTTEQVNAELPTFHALNVQNGTMSVDWSATVYLFAKRWKERQARTAPRLELSKAPTERFVPTEADFEKAVVFYAKTGRWPRDHGPDPMSLACRCPKDILERHGIDPGDR